MLNRSQFSVICLLILMKGIARAAECFNSSVPVPLSRIGIITSPGYDKGSYPVNSPCTMPLDVPKHKYLRIKFTDMDIERHHQCHFGALTIQIDNLAKIFCSNRLPDPMTIRGNHNVTIIFRASSTEKFRGFRLEYRLLNKKDDCKMGYKCRNGKCFKKKQRNNGVDNCGDGTDEEQRVNQDLGSTPCGVPMYKPTLGETGDRIVGGMETQQNSWPFQISFQSINIFPSGHFCGGTIINNQWAISAAHCFQLRINDTIRIKFADHRTYEYDDGEFDRYAQKIFIHPDYDYETIQHDIALVKFNAPIQYSKRVLPICLPKFVDKLPSGAMVHTIGWGETYVLGPSEVLKQATLQHIPSEKCNPNAPIKVTEDMICAGNRTGDGICSADSGGPMMYNFNGRWTLFGVVSWGPLFCGHPREPDLFSDVRYHIPWIENILQNHG